MVSMQFTLALHRLLTVSWDKSVSLWDMSTAATQKTVRLNGNIPVFLKSSKAAE